MELIINANNQTQGRDYVGRLLQYTNRIIWHQMVLSSSNKFITEHIKKLELRFFSFRKMLRLGRCFETFYTAFNSLDFDDPVIRITVTSKRIANALFLYCDHVVWLSENKLLNLDPDKWQVNADTFSLLSVILSFIRDLYELYHVRHKPTYLRSSKLEMNVNDLPFIPYLFITLIYRRDVFIDLFIQFCDLLMLLTSLSLFYISPSVEGMLGVIGAIAGYITLLDPMAQLKPN